MPEQEQEIPPIRYGITLKAAAFNNDIVTIDHERLDFESREEAEKRLKTLKNSDDYQIIEYR